MRVQALHSLSVNKNKQSILKMQLKEKKLLRTATSNYIQKNRYSPLA